MTQKNIWNFEKCCKGCMPNYTYGAYVNLNNRIDATKEYHNKFLLNQVTYFSITSLSTLMDETLTFFPKFFINKMKING